MGGRSSCTRAGGTEERLSFTLGGAGCLTNGFQSILTSTFNLTPHGQPQKETPSPDEQAQAQEALEGQSPQEAHLAEVISPKLHFISTTRLLTKAGFFGFDKKGVNAIAIEWLQRNKLELPDLSTEREMLLKNGISLFRIT